MKQLTRFLRKLFPSYMTQEEFNIHFNAIDALTVHCDRGDEEAQKVYDVYHKWMENRGELGYNNKA